ncbi:copper resistance CopC/CopD family protein [Nitriliruptor alkaliphilus]|uniref:copper resistance CopC/CopD family protein n=1 Tax=Nitriliruptor alkaliphilus TaxID=427918 RepID=UPI0006986E70|nr:copper resistance protein CopC [Nitriliruptor alkaliphilus]
MTTTTPTASRAAGRRRTPPQLAAAVVLAVLAVVLVASATPASAHAVLTGSTPSDGEALDTPPGEVLLSFNEPVATNEGALRVFDADGTRIDDGPLEYDHPTKVAVALPDLDDGAYVAAYRVVSADSHPISGTITFTVGDAQALDAEAVAAIAGPGAGLLGTVGSILRGLGYVGTLLAAGAVVFAAVVARGPADRRRAERVGRPAAVLGAAAVAVHLPVQAAAVSGFGLFTAVTDLGVLGDTLTSGFGQSWLARLVALLALAVPWFVARPTPADRPSPTVDTEQTSDPKGTRYPLVWLGAAAALALGSYLLDGHQNTVEPTWLLVGGDAVHLAGAAAWFGGLVLLWVTLRATRLEDDPVGAATVIARFSRLALWSVVALALAGTAMSFPLVRSIDALTSTSYGWMLLAKVGLVVVVVAIAAYNRQRLVPAITARVVPAGGSVDATSAEDDSAATAVPDAWGSLTRTVRAEALLVVLVLVLTGFLATTQPAAEEAGLTGPTMVNVPFGDDLTLELVITPSAAGLNAIHVYTLGPGGQPTGDVEEVRLEFTYIDEDIGPFIVEPFGAGPGHWTATIMDLRFSGDWEVRVVGSLGRFDEAEVTLPFVVR